MKIIISKILLVLIILTSLFIFPLSLSASVSSTEIYTDNGYTIEYYPQLTTYEKENDVLHVSYRLQSELLSVEQLDAIGAGSVTIKNDGGTRTSISNIGNDISQVKAGEIVVADISLSIIDNYDQEFSLSIHFRPEEETIGNSIVNFNQIDTFVISELPIS